MRSDRRLPSTSGRIADVRPFPLFDAANEPKKAGLRADIDFDGNPDLLEISRFGRTRLFLHDERGVFAEAPLLEGREIRCATRFADFVDLDGDGRPELFIAAPSDPVGASVLASKPPWLDGLTRRVQRDAATFVSGGVVLACTKEGRRDVTEALGLSHLAPFRSGTVGDFDGDGAPEIILFGGESDDMAAFWERMVPTFARVGADPAAAATAMASLAPPTPPYVRPRFLKRGADGVFAPVAVEFPPEFANFDAMDARALDLDRDGLVDLELTGGDGERLLLHNATRDSPESASAERRAWPSGIVVPYAVRTPAPALKLAAVNGQRIQLDATHERPVIVVRLDAVSETAAAAALAAEAKAIDWADVILLDASAVDENSTRARTATGLVSELMAGSREAAPLLWIDGDGFVDFVAGGMSIARMREFKKVSFPWGGDRQRALVALPRAEREARLPNLALAALTKLDDVGERELDFEFGLALSETRKPAEAAARFEAVSRYSPDFPRAQIELGRCLARTNRSADARAAFERAVDSAPADPVARFELGRLLLSSKEKTDADAGTESLRVATYLKPDFADAQYAFGQGLARVGRHDEAITALERALALAPESPQAKPAHELLESLRQKKGP